MEKKVYILEGLDCANCAAKIENQIQKLPGLQDVSVTYATKQLRFQAEDPDAAMADIIAIVKKLEPDVEVVEKGRGRKTRDHKHHDHEHEEHDHHHEDHDHCSCGCGPDHEHDHAEHDHHHEDHDHCSCECGCSHDHEHDHEEHDHHHEEHDHCSCGCGHDHAEHDHHHEEHDHCSCGCGHDHADHNHHHEMQEETGAIKHVYILEGLDCANCAMKIEAKLREQKEIASCSLIFATKQVRISTDSKEDLLPLIQRVVDSIEDGVTVVPKPARADMKKTGDKEEKKEAFWQNSLFSIGLGAALFLAGELAIHLFNLEESSLSILPVFLLSYLILGGKVLLTAFNNMKKGQIFDENFLMCVATIGAFAIGNLPEAAGVMLFYRIGEYFEHRATEQSRSQIMEAADLRPEVVNLVVGHDIEVIDAEDANVGDILLVRPGDRIPLDGVIVDGQSMIDTSPVTGEPVPVTVHVGDEIMSGCVNNTGALKLRVEKVLEESMVTRILDSVENAAASKPEIDKFITRFARVYTPFVVFFALFVAIALPLLPFGSFTWGMSQGASHSSFYTALTFLVISCPCALVLSVPLAFFSGIGAGSKKGILFKGGIALEALNGIRAVVMDKTGTITKGNFVVQQASPVLPSMTQDQLLGLAASCELSSTHPIGCSIVEAAQEKGLAISRPEEVEEIAGHGILANVKGDRILCGNRRLMEAHGVDLSSYKKNDFGTEVLVSVNGIYAGHIMISDTIKEDAAGAIAAVKKLGIKTVMLTGDARESADAVAQATGIDQVHAKLLPGQKLSILKELRQNLGAVMFVGDGINDAPVLAGADVGAAMGSGADAAIEAADVVFMNSEMGAIPEAIDIARQTNRISWQNVYFAIGVKVIVMLLGLFGFANMWIAVFADTGVSVLCLLNSIRILKRK